MSILNSQFSSILGISYGPNLIHVTNLDRSSKFTSASPRFSHLNNATLSNSPKQKIIPQIQNQFPKNADHHHQKQDRNCIATNRNPISTGAMATGVAEPLPPSTSTAPTYSYPPVIIILTIVLLIFFFAGFFSIYFCRCFMQNLLCTWHLRRSTTAAPSGGAAGAAPGGAGLDPSIVESFPTFTYSTVKDYTKERYGVECAICLVEFRSSDVLRLLTACCHVFHRECIDLWLESHKTCPVCRRDLNSPLQSPVKSPRVSVNEEDEGTRQEVDSCSVTIKEEDEEGRNQEEGGEMETEREKFSRSHSTGHSIKRNREGEEKYTLILPEEVKSSIISRHNSSKSWTSFGDFKRNNNKSADNHERVAEAESSGVPAESDHIV
ncbi:RING-H2 finger protein ATL29 [Salvia hispanica]|uniref:RING-H2 finger protein ATL29 n=1 Tax=Salvia hispanica TaxID=49212 RepID=UPI002008FAC0|nr:RING-H2 finger protein ATL29 [Salvia hispanica]